MPEEKTATETKEKVVPGQEPERNIVGVLKALRKGQTLYELENEMAKLIQAVKETKRPGKVTLSIHVGCQTPGSAKLVKLSDDVKATLPKPIRDSTLMYPTDHNTLQRRDPQQTEMEEILD